MVSQPRNNSVWIINSKTESFADELAAILDDICCVREYTSRLGRPINTVTEYRVRHSNVGGDIDCKTLQ